MCKILANMTQVSDVAPGPLVVFLFRLFMFVACTLQGLSVRFGLFFKVISLIFCFSKLKWMMMSLIVSFSTYSP